MFWSWQEADPEFGAWQAKDMAVHLEELLGNSPLEVAVGRAYVEVRLSLIAIGLSSHLFCRFLMQVRQQDMARRRFLGSILKPIIAGFLNAENNESRVADRKLPLVLAIGDSRYVSVLQFVCSSSHPQCPRQR